MTYATVRAVTSDELDFLRSPGHWSKLYLAFFKPSSVYTARLSSVPSTNDRIVSITFTGGSGTLADVLPDMTLYAGSVAGGYDLGVARIRKAPVAGTFYIGEESDIAWNTVVSGGIYLTVVNEFDLWAKHINTVDDETFYMDYDVEYSDQNSVFSPVPVMGSHRILKIFFDPGDVQFDFSNSYCLGSSVTGYSVTCSTAFSILGAATATPTLSFDTPGWHMVVLTVTAANGKTSVGVRYVYVYNDENMPTTVFQLDSCSEDYDSGGWSFGVTFQDEVSISEVTERSLCILFAEDFYDQNQVSIGQLEGSENIICIGKIAEESVDFNSEFGQISMQIQGMQHWLRQVYAFPTGVIQTADTPTNWAEMYDPTVDKVIFRLLHWGCTATKIMDVYLPGDTKVASELTSPSSNLWAQIEELSFTTIQSRPGVDRFGRLFIQVEPQLTPVDERTWATVMSVTKADWYGSARIQRVVVTSTGAINLSGVVVDSGGDSTQGSAVFALSPGHVFKRYGGIEVIDRLLLLSQPLTNELSGLFLGWRNNQYPNIELSLSGNNRMIDCFPRQRIQFSVDASDTPRGFSIDDYFIPRRVQIDWDRDSGMIITSISLEMETSSIQSIDGDIPGSGDDDPSTPTIPDFPDLPLPPVLFPIDATPAGISHLMILHTAGHNRGFVFTENVNAGTPVWASMNVGLTTAQFAAANFVHIMPNGTVYCGRAGIANAEVDGGIFIARAPSLGSAWTVLATYDDLYVDYPHTTISLQYPGVNLGVPESLGLVMGNNNDATAPGYEINFWLASGGSLVKKAPMVVLGNNGHSTHGGGVWRHVSRKNVGSFPQARWWVLNAAASAVASEGNIPDSNEVRETVVIPAGDTSVVFVGGARWNDAGTLKPSYYRYENNFADTPTILPAYIRNDDQHLLDSDLVGTYLMGAWDSVGDRGKSSDGGLSWSGLPALAASSYLWKYMGGISLNSQWAAVGGANYVQTTDNFGSSWAIRMGSGASGLSTLLPEGPSQIDRVATL